MSKTVRLGLFALLVTVFIGVPAATSAENEQKAVLVTGASSGIGLKITEHLSANGFFVYAGARKAEDLDPLDALEEWRDTEFKEPDEVAEAVRDFLVSDSPSRRYMVVPDEREAEITIRKMIEETVQLNQNQAYKYDRDALVRMLDEALASLEPEPGQE